MKLNNVPHSSHDVTFEEICCHLITAIVLRRVNMKVKLPEGWTEINPITGPRCPKGSRKLRFPDYVTMAQDGFKVSALRTGRFLPPGNIPGTHFC